jgi:hypothetical protein
MEKTEIEFFFETIFNETKKKEIKEFGEFVTNEGNLKIFLF